MRNPADSSLRLGLIAPKNSAAEVRWLLGYLRHVHGEPYHRGGAYDLVWFLNVTEELRFLRANTDTKAFVVGMEPRYRYPLNYESGLLCLADVYSGYRNFAGITFRGRYEPFTFAVYPRAMMRAEMPVSMASARDLDFCIFATHDPNIRQQIAASIARYPSIAAGPLFGQRVEQKLLLQRRSRYEFITENDINDYYFSEKLGESLVAGCVPIYYGCTAIKAHVPASLFIDMHDFLGPDSLPDIGRVIEHCLKPGVYARYRTAIERDAMDMLVGRFSLEGCLIEPVQRYIDELRAQCWSAERRSWAWRCWALRVAAKRVIDRG